MSTWNYAKHNWRVIPTDQEKRALRASFEFWHKLARLGATCAAQPFLLSKCANPNVVEIETHFVNAAAPGHSCHITRRHGCTNCGGVLIASVERPSNG